ncbi:hypothetical protein MSAN_02220700 [Mycena sanguinolenta]|uniref:ZZ-type domain-containing protein n=1 Tax=Mycena sanguinolenta TaxID=230812 RepID=A0A8H6XBB3_9AGAR|nr:hypothetical protein MSAN_02220700 [Mycena sanguinolenta]
MPFTVKATYGRSGELRKLTFPGQSFPTYEQLYNQLYRVFPISHNYYLSTVLFTPDSSNSKSTILLSQEVHNADEYKTRIFPYGNGFYSNAMLRFTVFDETPHKLPAGFVLADHSIPTTPLNGALPPNPFISASHIPPPPIILSSAGPSPSMDVDPASDRFSSSTTSTPLPQSHHSPQSTARSCCAVSDSKIEIEGMVSKFKEDLDRILKSSFATPASTPLPPAPTTVAPPMLPSPSSFCLFKYCTTCAKIFQGPWFACENCSIVVCLTCHETQGNAFCVAAMAPHALKKEVCAACPVEAQSPMIPTGPTPLPAWQPSMIPPPPQLQGYSPIYPFQMQPPQAIPFLPGKELPRAPAPPAAAPLPPVPAQVPTVPAPPPPAPPVIHRGIICDMCDKVGIEGIRHKCLDCHDYDLCTSCIESGAAERHNPFHEFLDIKEPGRVIVHTVYSGDGERDAQTNTRARPPAPVPVPQAEVQPVVHYATCNLCDSRIRGDRYKCADCPDFDTCSNCFSITREQHPHHAFVKLSNASDYIRREKPSPPMHFVTCDGCNKTIYGVRYKCMHPECPDYDLCDDCEAFPIPVHPDNHPLLKMRSPSTVVPTVYRVGQTTLINTAEEPARGRSPAPAQRPRSRASSFGPEFESSDPNPPVDASANLFKEEPARGRSPVPSHRSQSRSSSFGPAFESGGSSERIVPPPFGLRAFALPAQQPYFVHSPVVQPPSPFFFRSESSRSSSPIRAYQPSPPISPFRAYEPSPPISPLCPSSAVAHDDARWLPPAAHHVSVLALAFAVSTPAITAPYQPLPVAACPPRATRAPTRCTLTEQRRKLLQDLARADQERREAVDQITDAQARLALRIEEEQMRWVRAPTMPPTLPTPPVNEPAFSSFSSYWPKEELRHLMQHNNEPVIDAFSRLAVQEEPAVMDSPLTGEALLTRTAGKDEDTARVTSFNHSLAALLNGYESENESPFLSLLPPSRVLPPAAPSLAPAAVPVPIPVPAPALGLRATFVNDLTLPDGQIFPPGAEFMKCWQMVNSGSVDWPAGTELVYVAGERLAREVGGPASVRIGSVRVGAEVELWTGELKAPETPGRYVSYWRLRDDQGRLFGESIWIDINVTESRSSESSLSSSSIIVMPRGAQSVPSVPTSSATGTSNVRGEVEEDELSEHGSDASSGSLISVPTSDDEEWASVPAEPSTQSQQAQRYVVLYDDASQSDASDIE